MNERITLCIGGRDDDIEFVESLSYKPTHFVSDDDEIERFITSVLTCTPGVSAAQLLLVWVRYWCKTHNIDHLTDVFIGDWGTWENLLTIPHNCELPWNIHTTLPDHILVVGTWEEIVGFDKDDPLLTKNGFVVERVVYVNNYPNNYEVYKKWLSKDTDVLLLLNHNKASELSATKEACADNGKFALGYDLTLGMLITNLYPVASKSLLVIGNNSNKLQYQIKGGHGYCADFV